MKLAFSTLPCDDWTPERMIARCHQLGFSGLEIRETPGTWMALDAPRAVRRKAAAMLAEASIRVTDIGSSVCILGSEGPELGLKLDSLLDHVRMAADFGAGGVRLFLGNFINRRDDPRQPLSHRGILEFIVAACLRAADAGVGLWVETHNEYGTGAQLRQLLKEAAQPNLGVIWDVLHPLEDDEAPPDTWQAIRPWCRHIHIKDGVPFADPLMHRWRYTRLGDGIIPNASIAAMTLGDGYDGFFSLEWEDKWRPELQVPPQDVDTILAGYAIYMKNIKESIQPEEVL